MQAARTNINDEHMAISNEDSKIYWTFSCVQGEKQKLTVLDSSQVQYGETGRIWQQTDHIKAFDATFPASQR